ncbi:hypothetical protein WA026_015049 [Henosepilachna vigintioctopunctata]|uniref:Protein brunelleschi n=1 Tax=Henosepilachna vigintioctopunctata TaxID=420089 RepID=A0AAW1UA65_9CUCU
MRSSVSYILSSTTSEPNMSHPDYEQFTHDHAALLILIRQIGSQLKSKTFYKFFDRISKNNNVKITDSTGQVRNIFIRYVKQHPVENNDWGDFQTHRRLLGLITLGKYDTQVELNEICRVHESLKVKYTSTLYDSRCILFGPPKETDSPVDISSSSDDNTKSSDNEGDAANRNPDDCIEKYTTPSNFKTRALFYSESSPCSDLEDQLIEFIHSLFWILESKRLERSREKLERVSLLLAPFEKKDFVGLDMESRNNKKRCAGRMTKRLGDLCLQAGLLNESLVYYATAADTLKTINDWLWLGAAYEGHCAASSIVLYPNIQRGTGLHRNASLQEGSPKKIPTSPITNVTDIGNLRKTMTNLLAPEEIAKKYREAIIHYSKYQNAGIVETEASFKAARIAVEQNHALQAASFLQNVVYINLTLSEQEKIERFETLADLYTQIGFIRKASFCQRLAATRYVSPQNPSPNWSQCYNLMVQSLPGHRLTLDPVEVKNNDQGWPALQIQLLQELVVAAKRMGHSALATRHMTFLLQTMWKHLSPTEQKELCIQLQSLAAQCEGAPVALVLDSGAIIPPANLTNIPICQVFTLRSLQPHLQPRKLKIMKQDSGPFLFTPIHFGSLERNSTEPKTKMDFLWVEGDLCSVSLKLLNPLPFELKVSDMRLLSSGVVFESIPETVILPPDSATLVTLSGTPKEHGELELQGYSTHALGVKSNCRLKHMEGFLPHFTVQIVPSLPIIEVTTSLPQSASFSSLRDFDSVITSASLSLYHGENSDCIITLTNKSQISIEYLEISIQSALDSRTQDKMFVWSDEAVQSQLPIQPGGSATIKLNLYAQASFIAPLQGTQDLNSGTFGSSFIGSAASAGPSSLPSRLNSPNHSLPGRRTDISSSFRSSNSGHSSTTGWRSPANLMLPQNVFSSLVEGQLQLRYSGGPGFEAEQCRTCSVFFTLEILPSLQVTNWDVLPADTPSHFYLVLDIANLTSQEMELEYAPSKTMHIEGHESCRVPVPVERCPLSKFKSLYTENLEETKSESSLDLDKIYSEHIAELVDLKWQLSATEAKGKASLQGITLAPSMLDIVGMSPILWEIQINGSLVKPQEEISCEAGDCLELLVKVTNCLDESLHQIMLCVQFYQDYENGNLNYRMEARLAMTGTQRYPIACLDPQQTEKYTANVIFFSSGQYKLGVKCSTPENSTSAITNENTIGHLWKFIPPVNFIVT